MFQQKVLIVDDKPENTMLLRGILEDMGLDIHAVHSGEEAVEEGRKYAFDSALIDIRMPSMDGFECAKKLKQIPSNQSLPIIFVTAELADQGVITKSYNAGGIDCITKPFNEDELCAKVKSILFNEKIKKELDEQLRFAQNQYRQIESILDQAAEGVLTFDDNFRITYANSAASLLLTKDRDKVLGCDLKEIVAPHWTNSEWYASSIVQIYRDSQCNQCADVDFWRDSEHRFPVQYTQSTIIHEGCKGGIILFQDNTENRRIRKELIDLANFDHLTKTANRTLFSDLLDKSISFSRRYNSYCSVLMVDLDDFKVINDSYGHTTGDKVLMYVAEKIKSIIRSEDVLARLGGDEFALLLQNIASPMSASVIANKIIESFSAPTEIAGKELLISCSVGISIFKPGMTREELISQADTAMYEAKKSGKNNFKFFSEKLQKGIEQRRTLVQNLKKAIEGREFDLYYQPQYMIGDNTLVGVEALIRWKPDKKNYVSPATFIPVAEEEGLIKPIGAWCFDEVCRRIQMLRSNIDMNNFSISVNVSGKELSDSDLSEHISYAIDRHDISYGMIHIEVTETSLMADLDKATKTLTKLRKLGIKISIDDFGTGYSSLNYLKCLPLDILKIDRTFVRDIGIDKNDESIIKAIISLAKSLGLDVIAEGIETREQETFLIENGCKIGQGFLFSRPLPYDRFISQINKKFTIG